MTFLRDVKTIIIVYSDNSVKNTSTWCACLIRILVSNGCQRSGDWNIMIGCQRSGD